MRTLIVSDLHLGGLSGVDLLRRRELREPLLELVADVDRLVLLGDVLELRHGPPHEALAASRPFFEDVGRALGDGELIVTAGNHDHLLVCGWLDAHALTEPAPPPLGLEQLIEPAQASPALGRIARWAAPARVRAAYPGLWLRPDVYATHGHFLDCHLTIPTLERIGIGAIGRMLERGEHALDCVEDYEALTAPIYCWRDAMVRYAPAGPALNGVGTVRAWRALQGKRTAAGERRAGADGSGGWAPRGAPARLLRAARARVLGQTLKHGFPAAVAAINRAGMGPVHTDISGLELYLAGLRAMGEVTARLGPHDGFVVFGHTHRAGPLPSDRERDWRAPGAPGGVGARLVNCGCWTYESIFLSPQPGESPYWPGTCVLVEDAGPPKLRRLLLDRAHAELAPAAHAPTT
jgi:hypothetical protein